MAITMPRAAVEAMTQPRQTVFPEGLWSVTLEEVRERSFPDFVADNVASGKNCGYVSGDGTMLGLQFGSASNIEGDTTNQKLFVDLVVRDGDYLIDDPIPEASWQMQNSAKLAMTLAIALGATDIVELDGQEVITTVPDFIQQLADGYFIGTEVMVNVYHRNWKSGDRSGTEVKVGSFTGV